MPTRHMSIKQVREDRLKTFVDGRLIKAISHPVRAHILAVLNERTASTTEIGDEIELDVSAFYKHVQMLEALGCIECVETRSVRGVKEHFFRAKSTLLFGDAAWRRVPATFRRDICVDLVQAISDEAVAALDAGKLGAGRAEHLSLTPMVLDARGRREVIKLLNQTLRRLISIHRASARRLAKAGKQGIPVTAAIMGFEADRDAG
jgi:hypothetical protein